MTGIIIEGVLTKVQIILPWGFNQALTLLTRTSSECKQDHGMRSKEYHMPLILFPMMAGLTLCLRCIPPQGLRNVKLRSKLLAPCHLATITRDVYSTRNLQLTLLLVLPEYTLGI